MSELDTSAPSLQQPVTLPGGNPVSDVTISEQSGSGAACDPEQGSSEAKSHVAVEQGDVSQGSLSHAPQRNKYGTTYDWPKIEQAIRNAEMTYREASEAFNCPEPTIRRRATRKHWVIGARNLKKLVSKQVAKTIETAATAITADEIEKHKRNVFDKMSKSLTMFKAKAPRSFREAETADKMARRSAGLQDDQTQVGVLLQLNEAINTHEPEAREPIEAELVPTESEGDSLSLEA